jgi:hypothetical protein
MMRELMGMFGLLLSQIEQHQIEYPEHGSNCACMDKYIREIRVATESQQAQQRIDYVLNAVAKNRPVPMVAVNTPRAIGGRR